MFLKKNQNVLINTNVNLKKNSLKSGVLSNALQKVKKLHKLNVFLTIYGEKINLNFFS